MAIQVESREEVDSEWHRLAWDSGFRGGETAVLGVGAGGKVSKPGSPQGLYPGLKQVEGGAPGAAGGAQGQLQ